MPVHLYGKRRTCADHADRREARSHRDRGRRAGTRAEYHGTRVGGIGQMAAFQFLPGQESWRLRRRRMALRTTAIRSSHEIAARLGSEKKYHQRLYAYNYAWIHPGAILRVNCDTWKMIERGARMPTLPALLERTGIRRSFRGPDRRPVYHIYGVSIKTGRVCRLRAGAGDTHGNTLSDPGTPAETLRGPSLRGRGSASDGKSGAQQTFLAYVP